MPTPPLSTSLNASGARAGPSRGASAAAASGSGGRFRIRRSYTRRKASAAATPATTASAATTSGGRADMAPGVVIGFVTALLSYREKISSWTMSLVRARRTLRRANRRIRETRMLVRSFRFRYQPVAAHIIPIRRCNLSCTYCNEYDDHSAPVPTADVRHRIDRLVELGTGIITLSGGEPLLHPDLDEIVGHIRRRGAIATLITNGYLLTRDRIQRLNRAGLDHLQISIDNVTPDEVSKKSLKVLDQKLVSLAESAEFDVLVNSVVGSGITNPDDALTVTERAHDLGFSTTVGIIHDGSGGLLELDEPQRLILERIVALGKSMFDFANYNRFQK